MIVTSAHGELWTQLLVDARFFDCYVIPPKPRAIVRTQLRLIGVKIRNRLDLAVEDPLHIERHRDLWLNAVHRVDGMGFLLPVKGVLIEIAKVKIRGKETTQYTFCRKDGSLFEFHDSSELDKIIQPNHVGECLIVKLDTMYGNSKFSVWSNKEKRWLSAGARRF